MAVALPFIAVALTVASTAMAAAGAAQSANAQKAQANYQAQVASNNQIIANQNAMAERAAGAQRAAIEGQKTKATVGAIKAAQAASGVDVNSGSALDVRSSAAELGELNALTIRSDSARRAYGYETQSLAYTGDESLNLSKAASAGAVGDSAVPGTLLGGAASTAKTAFGFAQSGALTLPSSGVTPSTTSNTFQTGSFFDSPA